MFKKLKSIFIVEDESNAGKAAPQKSTANPSTATPKTEKSDTPSYDPAKVTQGQPDEKFINRLLGALEENNIEGFDYLEYKQSLQNLGNVQMDEATKFQSALAMAKTMGATSGKLVSSASHYLKILKEEENKFLHAFKAQQAKQVDKRNQEIKNLENTISQKKAQIEKLQQEIVQTEKALEQRKTSINQAHAKVQATKDGFYHAYHIVTSQIAEDLDKMQKYLS